MDHPSGTQLPLRLGEQEVVITEVGGGIRSYRIGDVDVLDGFPADQMCDGARGQTLIPWPNRVADGRYTWAGATYQLALTEPEHHNAIHGLTRWANWETLEHDVSNAHLRYRLHPQPGWPFLLRCDLHYALEPEGLVVRTTVTNAGSEPCPVAVGAHPYLSAGGAHLDDCAARLPGATYLPTDGRGIPTGRVPVAGTPHDFQVARPLGDMRIDHTYTDLTRDAEGRAVVTLARPDGMRPYLWAGEGYPYLEIYTGDTLAPDRRRRGLGVEPMTAPPNALQTGEDLIVLEPARSRTLVWGAGLA